MTHNRPALEPAATGLTRFLCHAALWFGLVFATPLFVALHNVEDIGLAPPLVALYAGILAFAISLESWLLTSLLPPRPCPPPECPDSPARSR